MGGRRGRGAVYRVLLPLVRTVRRRMRVREVRSEAPGVGSVPLSGRDLTALGARAGQYFVRRFLDGSGWARGHLYSLSAAPGSRELRVTFKVADPDHPARLAGPAGDVRGAVRGGHRRAVARRRGRHVPGDQDDPLLPLLQELPWEDGAAVLIYRARSEADLVFHDELLDLEIFRGLIVHHLVGPPGHGDVSWLPEGWAEALCAAVTAAGVEPGHVHREGCAW